MQPGRTASALLVPAVMGVGTSSKLMPREVKHRMPFRGPPSGPPVLERMYSQGYHARKATPHTRTSVPTRIPFDQTAACPGPGWPRFFRLCPLRLLFFLRPLCPALPCPASIPLPASLPNHHAELRAARLPPSAALRPRRRQRQRLAPLALVRRPPRLALGQLPLSRRLQPHPPAQGPPL